MRVRFLIVALAGMLTAGHAFAGLIVTVGTYNPGTLFLIR